MQTSVRLLRMMCRWVSSKGADVVEEGRLSSVSREELTEIERNVLGKYRGRAAHFGQMVRRPEGLVTVYGTWCWMGAVVCVPI
ncbi:hypothetical protein EON64_08440 [archaeon]|nr:MAG: hypothetical protein EON64_08440 [archaeon]